MIRRALLWLFVLALVVLLALFGVLPVRYVGTAAQDVPFSVDSSHGRVVYLIAVYEDGYYENFNPAALAPVATDAPPTAQSPGATPTPPLTNTPRVMVTPTPEVVPEVVCRGEVSAHIGVNLRAGPSTTAAILDVWPYGRAFTGIALVGGEWWRVAEGYVWAGAVAIQCK